ncbi:MAG: DUF1073 domain-containing protein [Ruminiclostridium sp.]|nr:DUF1073 domain-containing protein [Ruminiclostridium sp.]
MELQVTDAFLAAQYAGNGLFAKIIDSPADEAMRTGFTLDGLDRAARDICEDALAVLGWDMVAATAIKWGRLFGGSLVVMLADDGGSLEDPLNLDKVTRIDSLVLYDRSEVASVELENGTPERFHVQSRRGCFTVHASRCLVFRNEVTPERSSNVDYWGIPVYYRIHKALDDYQEAHRGAVGLLQRLGQGVYRMQGLADILATEDGENQVIQRLQALDMARGMLNTVVVDGEGEDYGFASFSVAGVPDVIYSAGCMLSAVTHIPASILFGRRWLRRDQLGPLTSSSSPASLETWHSYVERLQQHTIRHNLHRLLSVILRAGANMGQLDTVPAFAVRFNPLRVPRGSEITQAELDRARAGLARAMAAETYVHSGVLLPQEVRQSLKRKR